MTRKKNLLEITAIVLLGLASGKPLVSSDEQHKAVDESADVVSWTQLVPAEELRAKVDFGPGYVVGGVHLEAGMYLLVHRNLAGVEGIYFYRMPYRPGQESIAKLRCTPIAGAPVDRLTVRGTRQGDGTFAVQTVQFPGSREIHSFERADVYLGHTYNIGGVRLEKGKYLVVHNSSENQADEPCVFFYELPYRSGQEPVAKMPCKLSYGDTVKEFTIKAIAQPDGSSLVRAIQFVGSREVHTLVSGETAR